MHNGPTCTKVYVGQVICSALFFLCRKSVSENAQNAYASSRTCTGGIIMQIREMYANECGTVAALIYRTVHTTCSADYTRAELDAWAPETIDLKKFCKTLLKSSNFVAVEGGAIIGFASIGSGGYLNRLYVHNNFQGRGIGAELLRRAEACAAQLGAKSVTLDSSKTAEGFYRRMGYTKSGISVMERSGVYFRNAIMKKDLLKGEIHG